MKKNFIKYIAALAVAPMLLSSCSDDFLNEIDPNRQTPTTFWTSEDNVMKGLSAVYNPFRRMTSGYYGGLEGIMHLQMRGDDLYPTRGEEPYIWEYLSFVNTTNTKDLSWGNIYEGIQMANEFIYRAATVDMDETKREQMIGRLISYVDSGTSVCVLIIVMRLSVLSRRMQIRKLMDCLAVMKCWNRLFQTLRKPSLVCLSFVQAMRTVV